MKSLQDIIEFFAFICLLPLILFVGYLIINLLPVIGILILLASPVIVIIGSIIAFIKNIRDNKDDN